MVHMWGITVAVIVLLLLTSHSEALRICRNALDEHCGGLKGQQKRNCLADHFPLFPDVCKARLRIDPREVCENEMKELCGGLKGRRGATVCLRLNLGKLSRDCAIAALAPTRPYIGMCLRDAQERCAGRPDAVHRCLKENEVFNSAACNAALNAQLPPSMYPCVSEVLKFCLRRGPGRRRLSRCLWENKENLSFKCLRIAAPHNKALELCSKELKEYCNTRNTHSISGRQCLEQRWGDLSGHCKQGVALSVPRRLRRCSKDIHRLCPGSITLTSIRSCLRQHKKELSASCQQTRTKRRAGRGKGQGKRKNNKRARREDKRSKAKNRGKMWSRIFKAWVNDPVDQAAKERAYTPEHRVKARQLVQKEVASGPSFVDPKAEAKQFEAMSVQEASAKARATAGRSREQRQEKKKIRSGNVDLSASESEHATIRDRVSRSYYVTVGTMVMGAVLGVMLSLLRGRHRSGGEVEMDEAPSGIIDS